MRFASATTFLALSAFLTQARARRNDVQKGGCYRVVCCFHLLWEPGVLRWVPSFCRLYTIDTLRQELGPPTLLLSPGRQTGATHFSAFVTRNVSEEASSQSEFFDYGKIVRNRLKIVHRVWAVPTGKLVRR